MYLKLLLTICFFIVGWSASANNLGEASIARLTIADGLTGETVYRVMTDSNGATWIATNGGVNAFDGKQLHSFRVLGEGRQPLEVRDLCETQSRYIYAATEGGLYRLAFKGGVFEKVLPEIRRAQCILAVGDTLYIGSMGGMHIYNGETLTHKSIGVSQQGLDNIVRQFCKGDDGLIWFLSRYDLNSYNPKTAEVTRYELFQHDSSIPLTQFAYLGKGLFIIGTRSNGLYTYDVSKRQMQQIEGVGNIVSTVQRAADGSICVATDGSGAYRLMMRNGTAEVVECYNVESNNGHCLPSNGTYCYYRDANGVNWFGFVRYGLSYTYYRGNLFKPFLAGNFSTEGINVRTFCRHGDDMIIGTQNGFYYVNTKIGISRLFSPEDLQGGHIVNTVVWYENRFYIGTFDGGLCVFDPQTMTLQHQTFSPLLQGVSIGDLKVGPNHRLWIGFSHGLMIVNKDKVEAHYTDQNSHIVGGLVLSITFDASGNAWLTGATGCSIYSARSHAIVEADFPKGFFNKEPWMRGASGHDGLVFMRTGPQTFFTNEQMTEYGELQLPFALSDKWCRNFIDDMRGHYLLASERGLFWLDYHLRQIMHFGYGEGLCGNYINDMSISEDSCLWVATSQGLFYANLRHLDTWKKDSRFKVRLLNIRCGSDLLPVVEQHTANVDSRIRLSWNMTSEVLQAEVFLPDYAKHSGRLFEYRLDGGEWKLVDDGQPMNIRHLKLGQHRMEVRMAGVESTASLYTIIVLPSAWAVFELVLLVVAMVLLWLWWRYRKTTEVLLIERNEIEDALIESEELRVKSEESLNKYERVKIDNQECEEIVRRMKEYIEREKVYTNADLKMKDLADVLHLSAPKLSQVFNLYLNENYYEFINRYRLEEFKRLIAEGENKRYTITALSEQCGFKKSNFFSTFRKVEGMTPAEYLKKKGVQIG